MNFIFNDNDAYCVYPAMSNESENLSDLDKKDRNKCHSSPFINVVKGVFFMVRVTLVPVSYLSALSAVHSYRVPGKFIRLVRIKQKFIRIAYLYSKCTDCRINSKQGPVMKYRACLFIQLLHQQVMQNLNFLKHLCDPSSKLFNAKNF